MRYIHGDDQVQREGPLPVSRTGRDQETPADRARAMVPPGDVLVGQHAVSLAGRAPRPGYFRRPLVLRSERRTLGSWLMIPVNGIAGLCSMNCNPFEAFFEAVMWREPKKPSRPGEPFHGGWESMAGHLARAVVPRTRNSTAVMLQLTDRRLQLVYVSRARSFTGVRGPVEVGWATELRNVTYIRDRSDVAGGDHEIGFADGSWCSVHFWGQGWSRMASVFPVRLSHLDPIPR
ncbi:hypothetical protein [Streptomyces caeruleatus]|uniref:Uncharacterized protein n=1 Tax=Streptomyces caeruleatus TaxID=661399 RepID=A0A101TPE6_9ACTN|nr:hypothetical protein [Streptomyces caeruleatus]KUN96078.1 hypothetical protein AQJ67_33005 [Streptomyces caeruleatus]